MRNTNVQIIRNQKESSFALLKRFQRKVQESGVLPRVRSKRYNQRTPSKIKVKKNRLIKLANQKKYDDLKRLGLLTRKSNKRK